MPETNPDEKHFRPLDGLRGLAILLVSLGHIFYGFYVFKFGWIGLNLFFVLSGYLITTRLFVHSESKAPTYFRNFYGRRILRIFPLYFGCLLVFFGILPLVYVRYEQHFSSLYDIQIWYWLYISNWRIILYGLPPNPVFFHFWSLAVEEQFYLVWPVIFILVQSFQKRLIFIAALCMISVGIRIWQYGSNAAYYNTLTAAEPLLLGCLIALLQAKGRLETWHSGLRILSVISALSLSIIIFRNHDLHITNRPLLLAGYTNVDLIWAYLLSAILLKSGFYRSFYDKLLNSGLLVWLGKYAYGIYVFHWIILQLFIYKYALAMQKAGYSVSLSYWTVRMLGIGLIVLFSYLSYNLFEKKFLRLKRYFI